MSPQSSPDYRRAVARITRRPGRSDVELDDFADETHLFSRRRLAFVVIGADRACELAAAPMRAAIQVASDPGAGRWLTPPHLCRDAGFPDTYLAAALRLRFAIPCPPA